MSVCESARDRERVCVCFYAHITLFGWICIMFGRRTCSKETITMICMYVCGLVSWLRCPSHRHAVFASTYILIPMGFYALRTYTWNRMQVAAMDFLVPSIGELILQVHLYSDWLVVVHCLHEIVCRLLPWICLYLVSESWLEEAREKNASMSSKRNSQSLDSKKRCVCEYMCMLHAHTYTDTHEVDNYMSSL